MKLKRSLFACLLTALILFSETATRAAVAADASTLKQHVDAIISPLMKEHSIPGMAVGITSQGERHIFVYGLAVKESGQKVTESTLFEIGSVSKTFTAMLVAYAQAQGCLSLADAASKHLPALKGSSFDTISVLNLGTYTAGGLPLQFSNSVNNEKQMLAYFKNWKPEFTAGSHRMYSNPSLGLFGYLAARSMGEDFDDLMEKKLFPLLGLSNTYIRVPQNRVGEYAYGYTKDGRPVRVSPGVLDSEAYGVKTTAGDLLRFLEVNMHPEKLDAVLSRAVTATRSGYHTVGGMTQGLGWEMYAYPAELETLLAGNSTKMILEANKTAELDPPSPPRPEMLCNKTGSTNGFGSYVVFIPERELGIVLLANKGYPNPVRVEAAYRILTALESMR